MIKKRIAAKLYVHLYENGCYKRKLMLVSTCEFISLSEIKHRWCVTDWETRQNSSLDFYSYMKAESMKKTKVGLWSCEAAKATRSELDVSADGLSSQPMSQALSAQK